MRRFILLLITGLFGGLLLLGLPQATVHADAITLAQTVQAGQSAHYQLELYNESSAQQSYTLTVTGFPTTFAANFTQDGPILDTVTVDSGGYGLVHLHVTVPAATAIGHYVATVTAVGSDGATITMPATLLVENQYALNIVSQTANLATFSGQEFTFNVTASNAGAAPVTNVAVALETPAKWIVQSDPPVVAQLEPGAESAFALKVLVPASQAPIDQPLTLQITSDQTTSSTSTLTVRVQKSPTLIYAAAVLIALAVVGVIVYIRAKGRR